MTKFRMLYSLLAIMFSTVAVAQNTKHIMDYLSVPGPITFDNKLYNLNWSSHPTDSYYKHEYIVKDDVEDKYNSMILLEVVVSQANIKDIVAAKVAEIKKLKEGNPVVNYQTFDNPKIGEYMIDFLLSANTPDGKVSTVERNVYRYKTFAGKAGQKGILLFGVSVRSYGNDISKFFASLKANKSSLINEVAAFKIPEINIAGK